ncbi:MAG: YraN family protein [Crocinitomicaceae bacterium]|nr:YraN family protein [Crocinitomicaceae bacterium]MBP6033665.1 YraN family protein [Crocinitomicaceae bacterium]
MKKEELGSWGEDEALNFLQGKGFQLIDRNIRFKKWEIDLVLMDGEELVVVEVKARSTAQIGEPWRAVTRSKQRQIIKVADRYVQDNQIDRNVRFDIISIVHNQYQTNIEHITDAFSA